MAHSRIPLGVAAEGGWRRPAAVLMALMAFMVMALIAGPVRAEASGGPCVLPRGDAHHSLGVDSWDATYPRPERRLDAAMVFLSFPDSPPLVRPAELAEDHFPATSDFFSRASYGRFALHAHVARRWVEMPAASTAYRVQRDWSPDLRAAYLRDAVAAADPHLDFSRYDFVYLVADPDAPGVNPDATKVVNLDEPIQADGAGLSRLVTVFEQSPPDRNVLAHETGHVFDLPDLYKRPEDGKGDWDTYVGDWDLMGSQFGLAPDPFGWHKWKVGWLGRRNVSCVPDRPGTTLHTLRPLAAEPLGGGGDKRLAVVRTGSTEVLVIEARERLGNDRALCRSGVLIYRVRSDKASTYGPVQVVDGHPGSGACAGDSVLPALADAPLGVGEGLATGPGGGVRVEVTGRTPEGGWEVKVTRGGAA